jgi:hypothetical protein
MRVPAQIPFSAQACSTPDVHAKLRPSLLPENPRKGEEKPLSRGQVASCPDPVILPLVVAF